MNNDQTRKKGERVFELKQDLPYIQTLKELLAQQIPTHEKNIIWPEEIITKEDSYILRCSTLTTKPLTSQLKIGISLPPKKAINIIQTSLDAHKFLWTHNLLQQDQYISDLNHWYFDTDDSLLIDISPSLVEESEIISDSIIKNMAATFCELIGSPQISHHGVVEYRAITQISGPANEILRKSFLDSKDITPADFLSSLNSKLPELKKAQNTTTETQTNSTNRSTSPTNTKRRKNKPYKKLAQVLVSLLLLGGGIGAYLQYKNNTENDSIQIYRDDDLPTVIAKLEKANNSEDRKRLYAQAVELYGNHPDIQSYSSGIKTSGIIVPEQYPTINEAIQAASSGQEIHIKPGIYKEAILLKPNTILKGITTSNSNERIIIQAPEKHLSPLVEGANCKAVKIEDITFKREEESGYKTPMIEIRNTSLIMKNCRIQNSDGEGILIEGKSQRPSELVKVFVDNSNSHGIHILNGAAAKVIGCEVTNAKGDGLRVEGTDSFAIVIKSQFYENKRGILFTEQAFGEISGGACAKNKHQGIAVFRSKITEIIDFTSSENQGAGLYVSFGIVQKITDSKFTKNEQHGIFIEDPQDIRLSENNEDKAIVLVELKNVEVTENDSSGLFFQIIEPEFDSTRKEMTVPELRIQDNSTLSFNKRNGLDLIGPLSLKVNNSNISNNKGFGIKATNEISGSISATVKNNEAKAIKVDDQKELLLELSE